MTRAPIRKLTIFDLCLLRLGNMDKSIDFELIANIKLNSVLPLIYPATKDRFAV